MKYHGLNEEDSVPAINRLLTEARARIAVVDEELKEARRRRRLVADALVAEFGGRVYFNGALAHGDANDPLSDFDLGIVVPDPKGEYGPSRKSAADLQARVRTALRAALSEEFPNLRIEVEGRKRSVLVRFGAPVTDRAVDFTGDVIVALDHPDLGLWIPRYDTWDRSDPEEHTRLILKAIELSDVVIAHANRLLKYWSGHHDDPLCSWHIKVLTLDAITEPQPLIDALEMFFETADKSLSNGDTPDPAGVGPDIKPRVSRTHARTKLQAGLREVRAAKDAEAAGRPLRAQHHLAVLLPEIVDEPDAQALADEDREAEAARLQGTEGGTGVGVGAALVLPRVNSWGRG